MCLSNVTVQSIQLVQYEELSPKLYLELYLTINIDLPNGIHMYQTDF
jgi:hypothetical protein